MGERKRTPATAGSATGQRLRAVWLLAGMLGLLPGIPTLAQTIPGTPEETQADGLEVEAVTPTDEPAADGAEAVPLYDVEVLIFSQRHVDLAPEYWSDDRTLPVPERSAYLTLGQTTDSLAFLELAPSQYRLTGAAGRLEQAPGYQVLDHVRWRQPGLPRARSASVSFPLGDRLSRNDASGASVITDLPIPQGYVRVSLERFLHADIRLRMPAESGHPAVISEPGHLPVFSLDETRRLRSGELHYIDHPALGVLIRVDAVR